MERGYLIAVEGHDKVGKSTLTDLLAKFFVLDRHEVVTIHFPAYDTETGKLIRDILEGYHSLDIKEHAREVQSLYAINRYEQQARIEQALMANKIVICDRYVYTGVAYGLATGLEMDWLLNMQHSMIQPDLNIFLDIDGSEYHKRCGNYESLDEFERDYETINRIRQIYTQLSEGKDDWITQFAVGEPLELARIIYNKVQAQLDTLFM